MNTSKNIARGGFRGGHQAWAPLFLLVKNYLEPYIYPYANTYLKISSCIDLKCLLYVCATVKYNLPILYSIIPTLCSVPMLPRAFGPPYSKILDPPLIAGILRSTLFVSHIFCCDTCLFVVFTFIVTNLLKYCSIRFVS